MPHWASSSADDTYRAQMTGEPLTIVGIPGSPYSRKLRAVLRYRRIPHVWVTQFSPEARGLPKPRVELLPQLVLPRDDGTLEACTDSTPLIRRLEAMYASRAVVPPDPVVAFLDALLRITPTNGSRSRCSTIAGLTRPTSRTRR